MSDPSDPGGTQSVVAQAGMLLERRRLDEARNRDCFGPGRNPRRSRPALPGVGSPTISTINTTRRRRYWARSSRSNRVTRAHAEFSTHVLSEKGRLDEAEAMLLGLLEEFPEEADYYAWYSLLMISAGYFAKAERLAEEAVRRGPEDEDPLMAAAICATVLHPSDESRQRLAELARRYPNSRRTLALLAGTLAERGELIESPGDFPGVAAVGPPRRVSRGRRHLSQGRDALVVATALADAQIRLGPVRRECGCSSWPSVF